jgi:hypothetical protein
MATPYWAVMTTFVVLQYTQSVQLDSSLIFSSMELMGYLRLVVFLSAAGISFLFELRVIFRRFVNIYTTENIFMQKIDELTSQPVTKKSGASVNNKVS